MAERFESGKKLREETMKHWNRFSYISKHFLSGICPHMLLKCKCWRFLTLWSTSIVGMLKCLL